MRHNISDYTFLSMTGCVLVTQLRDSEVSDLDLHQTVSIDGFCEYDAINDTSLSMAYSHRGFTLSTIHRNLCDCS